MTREDVLSITGPLEDRFVVEILESGASAGDLAEAVSWVRGESPRLQPAPVGPVARLCGIIEAADAIALSALEQEEQP